MITASDAAKKTAIKSKLLYGVKSLTDIVENEINNAVENGHYRVSIPIDSYIQQTIRTVQDELLSLGYYSNFTKRLLIISWEKE